MQLCDKEILLTPVEEAETIDEAELDEMMSELTEEDERWLAAEMEMEELEDFWRVWALGLLS